MNSKPRIYSSFYDFLDWEVYPDLNLGTLLPTLSPTDEGNAIRLFCPKCAKKTAYVLKGTGRIICSKDVGCGFNSTLVHVLAHPRPPRGKIYKEIIEKLANNAQKEIPDYLCSYKSGDKIIPKKKKVLAPKKKLADIKFQTLDEWVALGNKILREKPKT